MFETEKFSKESSSKFLKAFYLEILLGNTFLECKYLRNTGNVKYCNKVIQPLGFDKKVFVKFPPQLSSNL